MNSDIQVTYLPSTSCRFFDPICILDVGYGSAFHLPLEAKESNPDRGRPNRRDLFLHSRLLQKERPGVQACGYKQRGNDTDQEDERAEVAAKYPDGRHYQSQRGQ